MLRELKHKILNRKGALDRPIVTTSPEEANRLLRESLMSSAPFMAGRIGAFESAMAVAARTPLSVYNVKRLISGEIASVGWNRTVCERFCNNAGFFPYDESLFLRFADMLENDMSQCDILASFTPGEKLFARQLSGAKKIRLFDLEPFHHSEPWTMALKGKKVLVVHPYEASIRHQWRVRDRLFPIPDILPDFDLQIIKAVQSAGGTKTEFDTWFDALDHMKSMIDGCDFDIALIGCGAYGFHLAAHVKRMGRKAVHLGGMLQLLFGIMGKRWEGKYTFVNDYWIRPLPADVIANASTIENGCYW